MVVSPPAPTLRRAARAGLLALLSVAALAGRPAQAEPTVADRTAAPAGAARVPQVEARIRELHARLHIAPEQEPQWQRFTDMMRRDAARAAETFRTRGRAGAETGAEMTAVENMQFYADFMRTRADDVQQLTTAFAALYQAMPAAQRKLADQLFRSFAEQADRRGLRRIW